MSMLHLRKRNTMLNFPEQKDLDTRLYIEETDAPLPETLNRNTRYALFKTIATVANH